MKKYICGIIIVLGLITLILQLSSNVQVQEEELGLTVGYEPYYSSQTTNRSGSDHIADKYMSQILDGREPINNSESILGN
ncbi:MAG: hypothetical protein NUV91_01550 [Candidatus Omnitrophica bacterium]|nr:hypothetical protein [Candidatus Omnitrophota bacterium]